MIVDWGFIRYSFPWCFFFLSISFVVLSHIVSLNSLQQCLFARKSCCLSFSTSDAHHYLTFSVMNRNFFNHKFYCEQRTTRHQNKRTNCRGRALHSSKTTGELQLQPGSFVEYRSLENELSTAGAFFVCDRWFVEEQTRFLKTGILGIDQRCAVSSRNYVRTRNSHFIHKKYAQWEHHHYLLLIIAALSLFRTIEAGVSTT